MSAKPLATVLLAFSIAGCAQVPTHLDAAFGNESTSHKASTQSGGRTAAATGTGAVGSTATQSEGASTPSGVAGTGWSSAGLTGMSAVISVPLEGGEISPGQMAAPSTEAPAEIAVPPQVAGPAAPATIWDRVRSGFVLAPMENDLVREWENWYATRPDYVARMIDRSSRFMFHILEEVEKRRMPTEIALLPMIESAYNPVAYSTAHASGIWQFIPSTGRDFGLRQNWWYDGRSDVIAATTAALDYLEKLYGMFGDWPLALASYNWGEGSVSRAIARNRARGLPTDYQSLTMPSETRSYLPKLIAVKNIIANPARYGLDIANVPNEPFFETVTLRRHIDLKLAAKLAEMSVQDFKFLNPGHSKPVIRSGEAERIVLPRDKVALFRSNFEQHDRPLVSWQAVTVRAGQKPERIAADHGMTLAELKTVNGLENKRIVTGQPLLVPLKENAGEPQLPDMPAQAVTLPKAIQAAKNAAKTLAARRDAARVAAQKPAQRALIQPAQAGKERKGTTQQLRAEQGKRVKVVESRTTSRKSADKSPQSQRMRVASRD